MAPSHCGGNSVETKSDKKQRLSNKRSEIFLEIRKKSSERSIFFAEKAARFEKRFRELLEELPDLVRSALESKPIPLELIDTVQVYLYDLDKISVTVWKNHGWRPMVCAVHRAALELSKFIEYDDLDQVWTQALEKASTRIIEINN